MIQSVDRAIRILGVLQGARRLSLSEVASRLELPPSTVHGILTNPVYMGRPGWDKRGSPIVAEQATVPEVVSEAIFRHCQGAGSQAA